ncbi:hypothetical protein BCR42DRAFT_154821 [Absidia repens]|uniref:F-box domain-containing protein n=1 Tax=Absidia repens TaxID=90262 RepID=A0A1X2I160_9FUNG|nr:hypothetical protein BCR42DRAFT_154821 [Absidia repens]
MNNLGQLPGEIISLIIDDIPDRDLYTCALINKVFYATANPLLWRAPALENETKAHAFINCIMQARHPVGQYIRSLKLYSKWTDADLLVLTLYAGQLEELCIFAGDWLTDQSLVYLAKDCPHLKTVYLHCPLITHQSIHALGQECKQLTELGLHHCSNLSPDIFASLMACPLKELYLCLDNNNTATSSFYEEEDRVMVDDETMKDLKRFDQLTHLTLDNIDPDWVSQLLLTSTECWAPLSSLVLKNIFGMGDAPLVTFLQSHHDLTELQLSCVDLTDVTLDVIATMGFPHLTRLNLSSNPSITAQGVRHVVMQCPFLVSVELVLCHLLANEFPEATGDACIGHNFWTIFTVGSEVQKVVHRLDQHAINTIRLGSTTSQQITMDHTE